MQIFYSGMNPTTKAMVDASTGGSLNTKTPKQAGELIETMAANKYQMTSERQRGVLHVNATYAFLAQSKLLTRR